MLFEGAILKMFFFFWESNFEAVNPFKKLNEKSETL